MEIALVCYWEGKKETSVRGGSGLALRNVDREKTVRVRGGRPWNFAFWQTSLIILRGLTRNFLRLRFLKMILSPRGGRCFSKGKI